MTIYYNKKGEVVGTQTSSGYMSSYKNEDYERRTSKYVGDRYLPIVESGEWPETLAGGQFEVLNDLYNHFLNSQNALVKLCFKRMGIYIRRVWFERRYRGERGDLRQRRRRYEL